MEHTVSVLALWNLHFKFVGNLWSLGTVLAGQVNCSPTEIWLYTHEFGFHSTWSWFQEEGNARFLAFRVTWTSANMEKRNCKTIGFKSRPGRPMRSLSIQTLKLFYPLFTCFWFSTTNSHIPVVSPYLLSSFFYLHYDILSRPFLVLSLPLFLPWMFRKSWRISGLY